MDIGQTPHELGAQGPSQVQQDVALHSFGRYIFLKQFLAVAVIQRSVLEKSIWNREEGVGVRSHYSFEKLCPAQQEHIAH